jgi:glycolate oxidase FAD binding subunit
MERPVLRPQNEAELSEAVAVARGPLRIAGGGTRGWGRAVRGEALSVQGLSGVTLYEPGALTLVARAGTRLAEVEAVLAAAGQRLAFEPPDHRALLGRDGESTIGGVVAANASGPRRVQAGACRDALLGVRFVDGRGTVLKNGGRVMKNVTGYDLVKLMAGSHGTLGVLTEVSLKVLPRPESQGLLLMRGLDDAAAVAALSRALGSPYEVSAAAHLPGEVTFVRVEGFAESVAYRLAALRSLLGGESEIERDPEAIGRLVGRVRDVGDFAGLAGDVWRLSVQPSQAPALVARAGIGRAIYDWGGGLVWALVEPGRDLRADLGAFAGHATLMRPEPESAARIASFPPEPPAVAALSRGLRARFDPRGILNPGLVD